MEWRLVPEASAEHSARDGAWNMAVDEALLDGVAAGAPPVLRLYTWSPACVSFGRNQPARRLFDPSLARAHGVDLVRRPTGGLAVHHHLEITYAVATPVGRLGGPRETYREINRALVNGLRRLGLDAVASQGEAGASGGGVPLAGRDPCFQRAAPGEVVLGGRKLVGSAQRCERRTILQHGSILLDGDQAPVLLLQGLPWSGDAGAVTLREALGRVPDRATIVAALAAGFEDHCGTRLAPASLSRAERDRACARVARYRSDAWTWRR